MKISGQNKAHCFYVPITSFFPLYCSQQYLLSQPQENLNIAFNLGPNSFGVLIPRRVLMVSLATGPQKHLSRASITSGVTNIHILPEPFMVLPCFSTGLCPVG